MSGNELFPLLIMGVILVGVAIFVSEPLMRARAGKFFQDEYAESPKQHLLARKDSIYMAMKDLEFDYSTGKLSTNDFEDLRGQYATQATDVLKEIDELESGKKRAGQKSRGSACPQCGFSARKEDSFCRSCGAEL